MQCTAKMQSVKFGNQGEGLGSSDTKILQEGELNRG